MGQDGENAEVICVRREQEYFCKRDWTTQITLILRVNFSSGRMEAWHGLPESAMTATAAMNMSWTKCTLQPRSGSKAALATGPGSE